MVVGLAVNPEEGQRQEVQHRPESSNVKGINDIGPRTDDPSASVSQDEAAKMNRDQTIATANGHEKRQYTEYEASGSRKEKHKDNPMTSSSANNGNIKEKFSEKSHGNNSEADEEEGEDEAEENVVEKRKSFLNRPIKGISDTWFEKRFQSPKYWYLFYDLAVAAVLNTFSNNHDIQEPSSIPIFLSYYVIVAWVWTSQTHYDIRYQSNDGFHQLGKLVQIISLIYMGAASGDWNPGLIRDDEGFLEGKSDIRASQHRAAHESFKTVLAALLVTRGYLAFQYIISAWIGRKAGKRISQHKYTIISLILSCISSIVAILLAPHSRPLQVIKIILVYVGIGFELFGLWLSSSNEGVDVRSNRINVIGERYGDFTLIILGEGFSSVAKAFNQAVSGLNFAKGVTYAQVILTIIIMYLLFTIFFTRFRPRKGAESRRIIIWEALHFPLHFNLLLLLAALVNTIVALSSAKGILQATDRYLDVITNLQNNTELTSKQQKNIGAYFDQLYLEPSFNQEVALLQNISASNSSTLDPVVLAYQYFGQIMVQVIGKYGIDPDDTVLNALNSLNSLNTTITSNTTLTTEIQDKAYDYLQTIVEVPTTTTLSGTLWLFPTAGIALIFCALRSFLWQRIGTNNPPRVKYRRKEYLIQTIWIILGSILALLGLLSIGSKRFDILADTQGERLKGSNPFYKIVESKSPLVVVAVFYLLAYLSTFL